MVMYIKLLGAALLPVIVSASMYLLYQMDIIKKRKRWIKGVVAGVVFGIISVLGTVFGVDIGGATANVRDAAPLCAGLFFSPLGGIIAGLMGGIYRWFAASWGAGYYSQLACSLATIIAGFFAAALRKYAFEYRRPRPLIAGAIAAVVEVFHMLLVFITHLDDAGNAFEIVKICTGPMICFNAIAVYLADLLVSFLSKTIKGEKKGIDLYTIAEKIQGGLIVLVLVGFIFSTGFIYNLETNITLRDVDAQLSTAIDDVENDIHDFTDYTMTLMAEYSARYYLSGYMPNLHLLAKMSDISQISIVNDKSIIVETTNNFDFGQDLSQYDEAYETLQFDKTGRIKVTDLVTIKTNDHDTPVPRKYVSIKLSDTEYFLAGFDEDKYKEYQAAEIDDLTANRHIGDSGVIFIVDSNGRIRSDSTGHKGQLLFVTGLSVDESTPRDQLIEKTMNGEECYCMCKDVEDYTVISVYPKAEALLVRDITIYIICLVQVIIFALLFLGISILNKKRVVNEIRKVNRSLNRIVEGHLDENVDVRSTIEFNTLSNEINKTVDWLEELTEEAKQRMAKDLELAKNIQHSALPTGLPDFVGRNKFEIAATMDAAKEVGGDFFDYFMIDNKLAFGVSDVSGKGVPGAMFMMKSKTTIAVAVEATSNIGDAYTYANERLCENNEAEMFVTSWMGLLDINSGHIDFANAGHNPPVVYRKGEGYSYLRSKVGFVLAGMEGIRYKTQELQLNPGDHIFLYTDGVTEAQNINEELYGEDRLLNVLNSTINMSSEETLAKVRADLDLFVGEAEQFDDITMMIVEYKGV